MKLEEHADNYRRIAHGLNESWRSKGKEAFADFIESRAGMLATAYGARVIEWEEEQAEKNG